uniref:WW domain-containing protein n=1 Tax=Spumella elongata TaxID=89044 RepID=A0A7S3GPU5_9STRA|mmetsp:Transcript_12837/g.22504  ORF Transcript_12837/g.22504 Transcript_12837/m.22504 type:complete len:1388 (+) Transcript_12837:150-4313(+)
MDTSTDQFKEELDRLKSKYRKEALRAVAAADADGHARGVSEVKEAAERKIAKWKAIAEAVTSNYNGHSKPVLLVQHIVEQIYKDMKLEFTKDTEINLTKIKTTLLSSTSKLMETLPEIVLSSGVTRPLEPDKANPSGCSPKTTCSCGSICPIHGENRMGESPSAKSQSVTKAAASNEFLTCLNKVDLSSSRVVHRAHPPRYFIQVNIDQVHDNVVKGVFIDGQYVSYQVDVKVKQLDYAKRAGSTIGGASYSFARRNGDMKTLYQQLVKDHPRGMVPPVPNKCYKIFSRSRHCKLKKNEVKTLYRKRMFPLWLQYMANTEQGQEAHSLVTFLTGLFSFESLQAEAAAATRISNETNNNPLSIVELNQAIIHQRAFANYQEDETDELVQLKGALQDFITSSPTLEPISSVPPSPSTSPSRRVSSVPFDQAYMVGNKYLSYNNNFPPYKVERISIDVSVEHAAGGATSGSAIGSGESGKAWSTIALQLFPLQRLAHRDLRTVERDITQVEPAASTAITACRALLDSWCNFSAELECLGDEIAAWGRIEPPESVEYSLIDAVTVAATQTNPLMANIGETLQCGLFEPLEYLQGNCLQAARDSVDYVLKTYPLHTFLPEQSYYLVPSERPVTVRAGLNPDGDVRVGSPGVAPLVGVSGMTGVTSGAGASLSSLIGVGDLVAVNKVKEGVAMAVNVARSWDSCKRVRGAMMVQQLLLTAKAISTEHGHSKKFWEQAAEKMRGINVTTHEADAWGGAGLSGPENVAPALEESNFSLRAAIQEEIIGYTTTAMETRERFRSSEHTGAHPNVFPSSTSESSSSPPPASLYHTTSFLGVAEDTRRDNNDPFSQQSNIVPVASDSWPGSQRYSTTLTQKKGLSPLAALKSFKAIISRAVMPRGKRRAPSVLKPTLPAQPLPVHEPVLETVQETEPLTEEEKLVQQYNAATEAAAAHRSEKETSAPSGRLPPRRRSNQTPEPPAETTTSHSFKSDSRGAQTADALLAALGSEPAMSSSHSNHSYSQPGTSSEASSAKSATTPGHTPHTPHTPHTQDDILQQDSRQHRLAARRQAAQGHGHGNTTSKIKASGPILAPSHTPDVFGAAPLPAEALQTHAVFTSAPTHLPSDLPVRNNASQKTSKDDISSQASHSMPAAHSKAVPEPTESSPRTPGQSKNKQAEQVPVQRTSYVEELIPSPVASPMPSGWIEVETDDGGVYYYHSVTRVSRWDRPNEEVAAALEARIQQANSQVDEAVQRRKEEFKREKQLQEDRDAQVAQLQSKVKKAVDQWVQPANLRGGSRDVAQLLCTMHLLVTYIPSPESVWDCTNGPPGGTTQVSLATAKPIEVKKAYLKAVRFVHPDKLPDDLSVEMQMLAEAVFIVLTDAYNKYRARIEAASA